MKGDEVHAIPLQARCMRWAGEWTRPRMRSFREQCCDCGLIHYDILVSRKVLDLFKRYRVTGFEALKAKTSYPLGVSARPPLLFELVVTGWGGWAAPAAGVTLACSCSACGAKDYLIAEPSRLINPAAWDGSDLFIIWPLPGYRFASNRLATILRQEKISGVELIPARKIPLERGDKLGPGSIKYCMPENRARELSRRFGIS